jgi:hypothetical protein
MRFATFNQVSLQDLMEMAKGHLLDTVTDYDFLETLADQHCFIVPPWIMQASPSGGLRKVTRLVYNVDGQLDRPRLLVSVARQLGLVRSQFGRRFTI